MEIGVAQVSIYQVSNAIHMVRVIFEITDQCPKPSGLQLATILRWRYWARWIYI
jgi:hypothetical protein